MRQGTPTRFRSVLFVSLIMTVALVWAAGEPQEMPGLVVEEVLADSAAAKAGFKVGDRLLSYDGRPLSSPAALQAIEENTVGKAQVLLRIEREDETLTLMAPLGRLGIRVRPKLQAAALALYEEGRAAHKAQNTNEVITRWTATAKAAQEAGETAAAAWLYGRVGEIRESQRQWKEASEAYAAAWGLLK